MIGNEHIPPDFRKGGWERIKVSVGVRFKTNLCGQANFMPPRRLSHA